MLIVMLAVICSLSGAAVLIYAWSWEGFSRFEAIFFFVIFAASALAPLALLIRPPRAWRMRLGTDGQRFFLDPGNGKVEEHSFSELATSNGQQLLVGKRLIALRLGAGALFAEEELRGYIFARIPPSGRLDLGRLFVRALGQGSREMWWIVIALVITAAFLVLPTLFPGMATYFKAIAMHILSAK